MIVERMTVDQFEAFLAQPENADGLFELIHGEIVEKVPNDIHGNVVFIIVGEIYAFLRQHGIAAIGGVEVRHRIPADPHNDRLPDISLRLGPPTALVESGPVLRMPDFVVEVQSPRDSRKAMLDKAAYYIANGTRLVWLVYPTKKLVEVVTADAQELFTLDDTLDGADVLPGLALAVRAIFPA
jgi:Uma2 family endonuclease